MKYGIAIILALLLSCRENPPVSQGPSTPESNPTLAAAHIRLGNHKAAISHLAQLSAISPKWENSQALKKLPWPQSLKDSLNVILISAAENEPWPSPENDPTNTDPLPVEFLIEEPPLPSR